MTASGSAASALSDRVLVIERVFDAPRELVFEAWTEARHLVNWWGPDDFTLPFCEIDFRVGGSYRFCMRSPDGVNHWVSGRYQEIVRPEAIAFSWLREDERGRIWCRNAVRVEFKDLGGRTQFTLRQSLFESPAICQQHQGGWTQCIGRLEAFVVDRSPRNSKGET
jgi:uncharacterized protein YndB with AHSA1/START domain